MRFYPAAPDAAVKAEPLQPPVLAVLLGWGGSTSKQLRRLVSHFTSVLLCPVLTYINPMTGFLHGALDDTYVLQMLSQIQSQLHHSNASGFILYVHSNNGAFVFVELKKHLQDPNSPFYPLRTQLRGIVYDSAPAIHPEIRANGMLAPLVSSIKRAVAYSAPCVAIILGRAQYMHPFWTPAVMAWIAAFRSTVLMWAPAGSAAAGEAWPRERLADGLTKHVFPVPHLFLYSSADKLLASHYIESYIATLRLSSVQPPLPFIQIQDFKNTGHVQHFLRQPEEYTKQLRSFLEKTQEMETVKNTIRQAQRL